MTTTDSRPCLRIACGTFRAARITRVIRSFGRTLRAVLPLWRWLTLLEGNAFAYDMKGFDGSNAPSKRASWPPVNHYEFDSGRTHRKAPEPARGFLSG